MTMANLALSLCKNELGIRKCNSRPKFNDSIRYGAFLSGNEATWVAVNPPDGGFEFKPRELPDHQMGSSLQSTYHPRVIWASPIKSTPGGVSGQHFFDIR